MSGQSRSMFGRVSGEQNGDFVDRVRNDWKREADMFFDQDPYGWGGGFRHQGMAMDMDPEMEQMRAQMHPKFRGQEPPRGFPQERRFSEGQGPRRSESPQQRPRRSSESDPAGRERIIPIFVEGEEEGGGVTEQPSPRQQPRYARSPTADAPVMDKLLQEVPRDVRAHSCPPEQEPGWGGASRLEVPEPQPQQPPSDGAQLTRQRQQQKSQPGGIPIPVKVERGGSAPRPTAKSPPKQQQKPASPEPQPQPKPQPKPKTAKERAMERIASVRDEVAPLTEQAGNFSGQKGDKEYLFLDEMLTRQLIRLDDVEADGDQEIRAARRDTIMGIQNSLATLEKRGTKESGEVAEEPAPETQDQEAEAAGETQEMDVEPAVPADEPGKETSTEPTTELKSDAAESNQEQTTEAEPAEPGEPAEQTTSAEPETPSVETKPESKTPKKKKKGQKAAGDTGQPMEAQPKQSDGASALASDTASTQENPSAVKETESASQPAEGMDQS